MKFVFEFQDLGDVVGYCSFGGELVRVAEKGKAGEAFAGRRS
jgi:hypothetical protein